MAWQAIEEIFRRAFSINDSVEIVSLMEAAISVPACKHSEELIKRRKSIIKTLMFGKDVDSDSEDDEVDDPETTTQKTTCTSSKIDEERPKQQHHDIKMDSEDDEIDDRETTTQKTTCTSSKIDEERPKQQHHDIKIPARRKSDKKINVSCTNKVEENKASMELRLEATKRKLPDGYSKNQEERANKRIKVLDVKDIPAPQMKRIKALDVKNIPTPQKKNSTPRSRVLKKLSPPRTQLMRPLAY